MNQTPELSRPSDPGNRRSEKPHSKKIQKVPKKNLNAAFRGLAVEFSPEVIKEPADFSPVSEISDSNCNRNITQSLELVMDPSLSASSEPFIFADLTLSSTITDNKYVLSVSDLSPDHHRFNRPDGSEFGSVEADVAVRFLKRARNQVSNAADIDALSKQLLDELITTVVDELSPAKKDDRLTRLVMMKTRVVLACFLIWIVVVIVFCFLGSGSGRSYIGPLPT